MLCYAAMLLGLRVRNLSLSSHCFRLFKLSSFALAAILQCLFCLLILISIISQYLILCECVWLLYNILNDAEQDSEMYRARRRGRKKPKNSEEKKKKNRVYTYIGAQSEGEIESLIATEFTVISWLWLWRLNTLEQCNTVIGEEIYSAF